MSDSENEFENPSENTRLMDGHVATNTTDVRGGGDNPRKRRSRAVDERGDFDEVSHHNHYCLCLSV